MVLGKLGKNFIEFIVSASIGYLSHDELDKLFLAIEKVIGKNYFDSSAEANFIRVIEAQFDKGNFIRELLLYPHHIEILAAIAVNSNYMCDILIMHPEYSSLIFSAEWLEQKIEKNALRAEIEKSIIRLKTTTAKVNFLKSFKMRYMLKIGLNDLLGNYSLEKVTLSLSSLAESILASLFELCFEETSLKIEVPPKKEFVLISLGKLGGRELNYSSDVDLMVFFKENYKVNQEKEIAYHELLSEAIRLFIRYSSEQTGMGYLYRIDFRLRPDGKNSPLCRTLSDTMLYYETRGEDWERQMLIKMNFLCGNKKLYSAFKSFASQFIFQNYTISSVKAQTLRMKRAIENNISGEVNVKLFAGGIRDIEFAVQALQLINGKQKKALQTGNTLIAIKELTEHKLLSRNESAALKEAYIFYRRIEHFLQLMNDRQTHDIPAEMPMLKRLALFMKLPTVKAFEIQLKKYRSEVRTIFNSFVESTDNIKLQSAAFNNEKRAAANLSYLRAGKGILGNKEFDSRTIALFKNIEALLLNEVAAKINPDETLENFVKLVKVSGFPSIFYSQCKSATFLKSVVSICSNNNYAIEAINKNPSLIEIIFSSAYLTKNILDHYDRYSTEQMLLLLSLQYSLKKIDENKVRAFFTAFINKKIDSVYEGYKREFPATVLGLGSFAAADMNFYSDIDLVFLIKNIEKYPNPQEKAITLLKKMQSELTPFEVDCRLRPEGVSSPLIWDLDEYVKYIKSRARIWEFQTLLKISKTAGSKEDFSLIINTINKSIGKLNADEIKNEMLSLYRKLRSSFIQSTQTIDIKRDHGGVMTMDFITSLLLLVNPDIYRSAIGKNLTERITLLIENYEEYLSPLTALLEWNILSKKIIFAINILFNRKKPVFNKLSDNELSRINNFLNLELTLESINNHLSNTGDFFNKIFLEK